MDAKEYLGEPRALISREALLQNAALLRHTIGENTRICAMIKADAYGHGADIVIDTLCNQAMLTLGRPAVDAVAVASIDEAGMLPAVNCPVIIFRPIENVYLGQQRMLLEAAIRNGWVLTICSASVAEDVARIAMQCQKQAIVQVMIDTGMTRSGVDIAELDHVVMTILTSPSLRLYGLCTHFASSETPGDLFTKLQFKRFSDATDELLKHEQLRPSAIIRHVANSGGVFFLPSSHLDMVRPGISLYGIDPSGRPSPERALRPAMKWTAPLLMVRDVRKGQGVGYGQTWHAPRDTRIGLVPVGYADGYLRSFSNRAVMMVAGQSAPVVGRVSMDLTTIDLANVPHANIGDEVTILDDDPLSPASVYQLSDWADTIPYEVFCRIGRRVHRVAVGDIRPRKAPGTPSSEPTA